MRMGELMGEAREAGGADLVPGMPWVLNQSEQAP